MAERDRYRYWNEEQHRREPDRSWSRDSQQQSWQDPRGSQWAPESNYDAQIRYGERQYGGPRDQEAEYRGYRSQAPYRGDQPSGYGGYGSPTGYRDESHREYGPSGELSGVTGYRPQAEYGGGWRSEQDARQRARIFRRGPKGYKRSDDRIREDVCERLMHSDLDVSDVTVIVMEGTVILEGTVPERRTKHGIEDIAEQSLGVTDVDNKIRISRPASETSWSGRRESSEVDGLNRCLRSELSAIETYRQALDRDRNQFGAELEFQRLSDILRDHEDAAARLREGIMRSGGEPSTDSGAWGTWSKIIMGAARLFGEKAALKASKEGEESGLEEYQRLLRNSNAPPEVYDLAAELMARQQRHIRELDSLMAALERR